MAKDTIAAIATANAKGAVSLIRVSGDEALQCVSRLMKKDLTKAEGYTIVHGTIYDREEPVDNVLVSVFHAPRSYTGEDIAEIGCHGGVFLTRKVLRLILGTGVRMARPGEFTERAFLNGKMDLAQAESVNDLVNAKDDLNARSAIHSVKGSVRKLIDPLEEELTQIIANIEVNIDYPEYDDVHQLTEEEILPAAEKWLKEIRKIIETAENAASVREGIDTVILGRPNVGKSSLLNALLEEDKAIVTDIAGTTRDLVEGTVRFQDITLNLIDTAGIRESEDTVEKIGIERSLKALEKAQLVILVLDATSPLTDEDRELLKLTEDKERIVVWNKTDITPAASDISISAIRGDIDALKQEIVRRYERQLIDANTDTLNNDRQIGLALQAESAMNDAVNALKAGMELDLITIDLEKSWTALKEITGKAGKEDLLDEIFSRFCLGK
ncbi:MAG TPA: tRNA uridine-5-carboxymethylaminomethyl(34) synthesis GTPase MnmE [Erysipelotrichaceae bacterium]|nr:tRNA uridine-5-carboxymethylaminomethyl(34) synthesis GTPase MnmE [Erysipelotrichaceae bacterium]